MQKRSSKSESTQKTKQNRSCWKILTMIKVNGQRSKSTVRVNNQRMTCADVAVWRHLGLTWQEEKRSRRVWRVSESVLARRGRVRRVAGTDGVWWRVERMEARVMQFLAVLGWVLLGIGCSVFLCLFFGSWMHRTLISERCRYCGRDGGGSLLTVTTEWRRGQQKNAGDVHRNQKVRGMALIPC